MRRFWFILLLSSCAFGQSWTGILSSSRAIDWSNAGLPATLPDGETTPNPWTPPTRTQCVTTACNTLTGSVTQTNLNNAIASAPAGTYVLLPAGTFNVQINLTVSNVTVRGAGASQTILSGASAGKGQIGIGIGWGGAATLTASPAAGATTVTASSVPSAGQVVEITQCDKGFTAANANYTHFGSGTNCTGAYTDPKGPWVCGLSGACARNSTGTATNPHFQEHVAFIKSVNGNTLTLASPLYNDNWSTSNTASITWLSNPTVVGAGIEDMTIVGTSGGFVAGFSGTYACWIKGVRMITQAGTGNQAVLLTTHFDSHDLVANSYLAGTVGGVGAEMAEIGSDSGEQATTDFLFINNIIEGGYMEGNGDQIDNVWAYNFFYTAGNAQFVENGEFQHHAGTSFLLREGNQMGYSLDDDTWGTHNFNTWFRNFSNCNDPQFPTLGGGQAIQIGSWARFDNLIGNAITGSACSSTYAGTIDVASDGLDATGLTQASFMRWGNYVVCSGNSHCNVVNFDSAEVPSNLSSFGANATPYQNALPANHNLPASFLINGMGFHPAGGTGLSWWKACSNWATFPTACASSSTPPMPPIGPDVSGGQNIAGHAYNIPAQIAWTNFPVDNNFSTPYGHLRQFDERAFATDSGGSGASPPTFSPVAGTYGPNQTPSLTSATSGAIICWAVSPTTPATNGDGATCATGTLLANGGTISVNTSETINAVAGTASLADSTVASATYTITGVAPVTYTPAAGSYSNAQTVKLSSTTGAGVIICYTTDGSTPTTPVTPNGTCTNGTAISNNGSISVSTSLTVKALGTETGWNNSAVTSATYAIASPSLAIGNLSGGMVVAGGMKILGMGSPGGGGSLCGPPAYLCSLALNPSVSLSTQPVQLPNPIPPMGQNSNAIGNFLGANSIVTDNICNGVSGCSNPRILRVSDGGTSVSVPDPTTCSAPANFSAAADFSGNDTDLTWNSNDTYFGIAWNSQDKFCIVPFNPSAFQMLSPSAEGLSGKYYLVPSKKISWSHSNPLVLYDIEQGSWNGTVESIPTCPAKNNATTASLCINKYDFTGGFSSPTITTIYDFLATGNCLANMAAGGPTTGGVLTVSYDDTVFSTDESDTGPQDSAQFEVVYKIGTGCTVWNTWNVADAGIPAGTIVLPNGSQITPTYQNASNTSQFLKIHESFGHGNGTTLLVSASTCTGTNPCSSDGPFLWVIGTSQVIATQSSGHFAMGYDLYIHGASPQGQIASITTTNPPVNTFLISSSSPNNLTGFVTPPGFELHISWNNAANTNTNFIFPEWDTVNIFNGINGVNGTPNNPFTSVGQNEIDGYPASAPGSAGALIHRMGHLYISSFINNNTQFTGAYGIMTTSQTGKYATFTSDWICGVGASNGTNTPVCPGAGWQASTAYPSGFVLTPGIGVSKSGNSAWNTYKSAGSCTTSASQQFTITSIAETGTTATATISGTLSSLFQVGSVININGTSTAGYNTPNYTLTGVTSNTVTFTAASGLGSSTGGSANFQWQQANTTDGSCTWNYQAGSAPRNDVFVIELK